MPVGATALKAIRAAVKQVLSHSWNRKTCAPCERNT